ncbi:MAG: ATP-binding protein [Sphingorhabdus sp.]
MSENSDTLRRIADALERLAPPAVATADLTAHPAYHWDGRTIAAVANFAPLDSNLIVGVDRQKQAVSENSRRLAMGYAAHDMLLWGARGMGKSALVKSVTGALQAEGLKLALVEATADQLASLPQLFAQLSKSDRRFILFIDDMAFEGDDAGPRRLRSLLEGGSEARPDNVRLYVTSNRRNIVERNSADEDAAVNARDVADDRLALADRFGLKLGFQYPDQAAFLDMVSAYAKHFALDWDQADALAFAHQRGGRSGRVAWHYAVELAGRAGRNL